MALFLNPVRDHVIDRVLNWNELTREQQEWIDATKRTAFDVVDGEELFHVEASIN